MDQVCYVIGAREWGEFLRALGVLFFSVPLAYWLVSVDWWRLHDFIRLHRRRRRLRRIRGERFSRECAPCPACLGDGEWHPPSGRCECGHLPKVRP